MMLCSLKGTYKRFGGTFFILQEGSKMVKSSMQLSEENVVMGLCMN
jgi:hypothetical protein